MATTNYERITQALGLLRDGLKPFVERELQSRSGDTWAQAIAEVRSDSRLGKGTGEATHDVAVLLVIMDRQWAAVFRHPLGRAERSLVNELNDVRNRWAHQESFSSDDTDRALDSVARLLSAVSAPQADAVLTMKRELRRLVFDEQVRSEKRKTGGSLIDAGTAHRLTPWREVVTPHPDVASGRYQQAEFAADLWQVHLGQGAEEYRQPEEFFRRTFLTESLTRLLVGGVQRLAGQGGDPVVQLQTNFGGGKTHSMLALYHLCSRVTVRDLAGVDAVLAKAGLPTVPAARRVVLVGNRISPGNPVTKPDGTVVRTLWGELAYQLGGPTAFARIAQDDEKATSPGDVLRELLVEYGPCLILVDEWVAYARQLHDQPDLPAGTFETMFTFAQALTESVKLANTCLLVISLPASDTPGSPHTQADDVEVGGLRGRDALARLRNVVGRIESSWRPATAEESFEIVRRRLFEPLGGPAAFTQRDVTVRAFAELYRTQAAAFPKACAGSDYETRMQAAYPIHPEIFDRLYTDWSTLVTFQRTRGVLRLMAAVIHSLWEKGDRNPLILPSMLPIDDPRVQFELTRYLSDNWVPIIARDVDGSGSLPVTIDGDQPNLGKLHATRRVARTIYLGSAPTTTAAHRGLEDRQVALGCVMPGESPVVFGDALRRLAAAATYLYQDGTRAWYATQPTVTKLAEDRAEQFSRDHDTVTAALDAWVRADLAQRGDFARVHPMPRSSADVPDDLDARLVVLDADHPYSKGSGNAAEVAATAILETRGTAPRLYRNTLVFLAADKVRLQDLDEAVRRYLAWESIVDEKDELNLDPQQAKQAETQRQAAESTLVARLPETYQWVLVPTQASPQAPVEWSALRVSGAEALAVRVSKKLGREELLLKVLGATILRKHLDDVPLWHGDHARIAQLVEFFGRYPYLPRLLEPHVLVTAIQDGLALLTWRKETFAYADSVDEAAGRYRGLRGGQQVAISQDGPGLLVTPDVAQRQLDVEIPPAAPPAGPGQEEDSPGPVPGDEAPSPTQVRRFHGAVQLDPARVGRDASRIAEEVIAHLTGLVGADVRVTLEIEAELEPGAPDHVVRTVTENSRTLRFTSQGFERE